MGLLKRIKRRIKKIEPLKVLERRIGRMLKRWKKEFSDLQVEEVVVDVKIGGKLPFGGKARLMVTMKKKDS